MMKITNCLILILFPLFCVGQKPRLVVPAGHTDFVNAVAFSPDGRMVVTGSEDHTAKLWEAGSGKLLHTFTGHRGAITSLAFAPQGRRLATAGEDGRVLFWDWGTGKLAAGLEVHQGPVLALAFSPDGQFLYSGGEDATVKTWNAADGQLIRSVQRPGAILSLAAGDGDLLAAGDGRGNIQIHQRENQMIMNASGAHRGGVLGLAFVPQQAVLLSSGNDDIIRRWNTTKGELLEEVESEDFSFISVACSPSGKQMAVGTDEGPVFILDTQNNRILDTLKGHTNRVYALAYSPDGNYLISGSQDSTARIWEVADGRLQQLLGSRSVAPFSLKTAPNNRYLLTGNRKQQMRLWDLSEGRLSQSFYGHMFARSSLAFPPDSKQFAAGGLGRASAWTLPRGDKISELSVEDEGFLAVAYSPDGSQLAIAGTEENIRILDAQTGTPLVTLPGDIGMIRTLAFSPDGKELLSSGEGATQLWDLRERQIRHNLTGHAYSVHWVAFAPNEPKVFTAGLDGSIKVWDRRNGQALHTFQHEEMDLLYDFESIPLALSPDGQHIMSGGSRGQAFIWNTQNGQKRTTNGQHEASITALSFSPDGKLAATADDKGELKVWGTSNFELQFSGHAHSRAINDISFFPNGKHLVTSGRDHTLVIWDIETGNVLAKLIAIDTDDWVVTTPSGLFDASPAAMRELYYVVNVAQGWERIELEQLKARYYEPGLLQKLLGYSEERIRPILDLETIELFPEVEAKLAGNLLRIRLHDRRGGIGKVSIFINGKEIEDEANPLPRSENAQRDSIIQFDLQPYQNYLYRHPDSTNLISLRAYNEVGWLKSRPIELEYQTGDVRARGNGTEGENRWVGELDPKLYVISIGTSNYTGTKMDLQYADQDATMMAKALQSVGTALFTQGDSLEVYCLSTASADNTGLEGTPIQWQFAEKSQIEAAFKNIKKRAKAEDVIVVYLSGHGVTQSGTDGTQFYYLTQGISSEEDLDDPVTLEAYTISSQELTHWINDIPALKQVLMLDACNSGQIVENLTGGTKALNSSQIRALDRMKDRTGMFVLSGSASNKVSYEAGEYGQGLLTYALLQGMRGLATRQTAQGNYIDVMKLFQYARDEVPRLATSINGIQTPMLGFPDRAASFDIGILDETIGQQLPNPNKKPIVIRSNFLNELTYDDDLELVAKLEEKFREESEKGADADLIYVDVNDYPGAYALRGLYQVNGSDITLKVKLFQGANSRDLEIQRTDDPERLVRYVIRAVKNVLKD